MLFVPDAIIARMSRCDTKEAAVEEGIAIAREILRAVKDSVNGVQISAPFGKVRYALEVVAS